MSQGKTIAARVFGASAAAFAAAHGLYAGLLQRPLDLLGLLLAAAVVVIGVRAFLDKAVGLFSVGTIVLMLTHMLAGPYWAPDNLTSGAILVTGVLVLYVGLAVQQHLSRWHFWTFVAGYLVLYLVFVVMLENSEPLFILYLLGLAATARSLRLAAYFWAAVVSFSFCQPYAWESLAASCFLLTALFGARGEARSPTTLVFLGAGLVLVLSLLFPILTIILGQDVHSLELLLRDPRIRAAIATTLVTATVSTMILLVGLTPLTYALARLRFPGRELLLCLIDLPIVIPQSAAGIALVCLLGRRQFLGGLLADQFGLYFDGTVLGICLAQVFVAMPFFSKSALAAFQAIDEELEAVARTLGATPWGVFWRIALPLASRGVAVGAVLALARAAGEFGALLFLAPTPETAPMAVFNRFNSMGIVEVAPLVSLLLLVSLGTFFLLQIATRILPSARPLPRAAPKPTHGVTEEAVHPVMSGTDLIARSPIGLFRAVSQPDAAPSRCEARPSAEALRLCNVTTVLGAFRLGPVSLTLAGGDYLAVLGPGGCGKTTLLKTIAGILRPVAGEIHINGRRADRVPSHRRGVGYVPQHSLLFPHMTVAGNVRFGLRYARGATAQREERFARAVELTGTAGLLGRYPATLSGGESRRVALARALAVSPAALLLDEPLSMLDPEARCSLLETLRNISRQTGVVTLHVTHHLDEVRAVAGQCAVMRAGRIATYGPAAEVLASMEEAR